MVKGYNALEGTPTDINRRILRRLDALEAKEDSSYDDTEIKASIKALEDEIGEDTKADTVKGRIKALEDAS